MGETVAYKGFVNEVRTYPRLSEEAAGIACHRLCFFRQDLTGSNKFKVPFSARAAPIFPDSPGSMSTKEIRSFQNFTGLFPFRGCMGIFY
jgi:hypothetical protein